MNKYMLTIQHDYQKVAYICYKAENTKQAESKAESIFKAYKLEPVFKPTRLGAITGNFEGHKPRIKGHWLSKWIPNANSCNAWGQLSGGYWGSVE